MRKMNSSWDFDEEVSRAVRVEIPIGFAHTARQKYVRAWERKKRTQTLIAGFASMSMLVITAILQFDSAFVQFLSSVKTTAWIVTLSQSLSRATYHILSQSTWIFIPLTAIALALVAISWALMPKINHFSEVRK